MTEPALEHAPCGWCSSSHCDGCVAEQRPQLHIPCGCHDRQHRKEQR